MMLRDHHALLPVAAMRAYALIEVMISLLIVSVGLLGIAKMYALAIGNTQLVGCRSLAAIYAASLASAMHANRAYWQTGIGSLSTGVNGRTLSDPTLDSQRADCTYSSHNPRPQCTPVQLASTDLRLWGQSLQQLPGGHGLVNCSASQGLPMTCSITVRWNEKSLGLRGSPPDNPPSEATQRYVALVQP